MRALSLAIMTGDAGNAFTGALTLFEKVLPFLYFPALMAGGKRASNESGGGGKAKVCSFNIYTQISGKRTKNHFQMNKSLTDWEATDWTGLGNFKVASWNVAGNN